MLTALRRVRFVRSAVNSQRALATTSTTSTLGQSVASQGGHFDAIVIGAGIAGASAALGLTTPQLASPNPADRNSLVVSPSSGPRRRVLVIERESDFCFHSTGRSAAIFSEAYGSPTTQALSTATKPFLYNPELSGLLTETPLVVRRGTVWVGTTSSEEAMNKLYRESKALIPSLKMISPSEVRRMVPWVNGADVVGAISEPDAADMDVNGIWTAVVRQAKNNGALFEKGVYVSNPVSVGGKWVMDLVSTSPGEGESIIPVTADLVVNASGAWADHVAETFGVRQVGMVPKRRTIIQFDPADVAEEFKTAFAGPGNTFDREKYLAACSTWPSVFDMADQYYYKPDAGRILASPCDETPDSACDAQPDELDMAICVDRLENASPFRPRRILERWAGLRSFVKDKEFVIGLDSNAKAPFFWLASLGGYGIQTSLGNARLVSGLLHNGAVPTDLIDNGLNLDKIKPTRFDS